jgi:hypothetical protein
VTRRVELVDRAHSRTPHAASISTALRGRQTDGIP